jgi:hypothetical protein
MESMVLGCLEFKAARSLPALYMAFKTPNQHIFNLKMATEVLDDFHY